MRVHRSQTARISSPLFVAVRNAHRVWTVMYRGASVINSGNEIRAGEARKLVTRIAAELNADPSAARLADVAFGRVLANRVLRRTGEFPREDPAIAARAEELPVFDAEVWFPADPIGSGDSDGPTMFVEGISNGSVLRYVSEGEAQTLRALFPEWLEGPEPQPLGPDLLLAIFKCAL